MARLEVAPEGRIDPDSKSIIWSEADKIQEQTQFLLRVPVVKRAITIFLEGMRAELGALINFDKARLTPYPC